VKFQDLELESVVATLRTAADLHSQIREIVSALHEQGNMYDVETGAREATPEDLYRAIVAAEALRREAESLQFGLAFLSHMNKTNRRVGDDSTTPPS
jgi:hypothetical protein